jgi:ABC-type multidrug transport system ATPase subunit
MVKGRENIVEIPPGRDPSRPSGLGAPVLDVRDVNRRFGNLEALRGVSLSVAPGEIHALLGPNGAGKTTLLRILAGLIDADEGEFLVLGRRVEEIRPRVFRKLFGVVPSGDRSFYLRLSGLENLVFFGRVMGLRKQQAFQRARECLEDVGLGEAAKKPVSAYSHGMQKRLSVARALLMRPRVLFVDEATHDLDPEGARRVKDLVATMANRGTSVIWATQRLEEIRGFADRVTLLDRGKILFVGTVPQLTATYMTRRYIIRLHEDGSDPRSISAAANRALEGIGSVVPTDDSDPEHFLLSIRDEAILGDAISSLTVARIQVLACREERPDIENAFLQLTRDADDADNR